MDNSTKLRSANIQLSKELFAIKSSLDVERVIGLNVEAIQAANPSASGFMWLTQKQSQLAATIGLAKVFERENGSDLCSIQGIWQLAKTVSVEHQPSVDAYLKIYDVTPSSQWETDVESVRSKKQSWVKHRIKKIISVRNTIMAHMQQDAPEPILPSDTDFRDLLDYAVQFHMFINRAFLNTSPHPILEDTKIQTSFVNLLKLIGVTNPVLDFPD